MSELEQSDRPFSQEELLKRKSIAKRALARTQLSIMNTQIFTQESAVNLAYQYFSYGMYWYVNNIYLTENPTAKKELHTTIEYYHEILEAAHEFQIAPLKGAIVEARLLLKGEPEKSDLEERKSEKDSPTRLLLKSKFIEGLDRLEQTMPDQFGGQIHPVIPPWDDKRFANRE